MNEIILKLFVFVQNVREMPVLLNTHQNTITRSGGNTADTMDRVLQCVHPPTTKVKRIPTVRNSWKKAPKAPLIDVSAISPMYIGAATQIPPAIDTNMTLTCNQFFKLCN